MKPLLLLALITLSIPAFSGQQVSSFSRAMPINAGVRGAPYTDREIKEIQSAVAEVFPNALTQIGGATDLCLCEEGPGCTSQANVSVDIPGKPASLVVSKIEGHWGIGKLQQWQLKWQAFGMCLHPAGVSASEEAQAFRVCKLAEQKLLASKPGCEAPNNSFKADSQPLRGRERP